VAVLTAVCACNAACVIENEEQPLAPYTSALVRRHAAAGDAGEVINGSIVFLDIVGSTGLTIRFDALGPQGTEQLGSLFDDYFSAVFAIVADHGGDVIGMDGDSVIALWRHRPGERHTGERAATAAFALREQLAADHLGDAALGQRIVVTGGRLRAIVLSPAPDRRLLVLAGEPLHEIELELKSCAPGEVRIKATREPRSPNGTTVAPFVPSVFAPGSLASGLGPPVEVCTDAMLVPFLPRVIVDHVARRRDHPIGEFRTLTSVMLRVDGLEPDADPRLNDATTIIQQELAALGLTIADLQIGDKGTVVKFVTGLPPYSMDNNAGSAVEASRRILAALAQNGIDVGIGVATGRIFVGEVGNTARRALATIGPAMSRAARLMQAARGEILCDATTAAEAGNRFIFGEAVPMIFKGSPEPQEVRELLGQSSEPSLPLSLREMFGRDREVDVLTASLERLAGGLGGLVVIEAEAGVGKSRLLARGHALALARGCRTFFSAAQEVEEQTSYFAFRQVLAQLLGGQPDWQIDPSEAARRLRDRLDGDPVLSRAEVLTDVLPLDIPLFAGQRRLAGAARPSGVADLFVHLMRGEGGAPPLVLFLDDAHWLDASSARLLATVLRRVPGLLAIVASRPADATSRADLRGLFDAARHRLPLARLDRAATGALVRATLRCAAVPRRLIDHIHERSEGLPLHAEQLVLALLDHGAITLTPNGARVEAGILPEAEVVTLRDVIVRRVDLLPPAQQEMLRVASVLGRTFDTTLLAVIHPGDPGLATTETHLVALEKLGLLGREGDRVAFRHVRIQEVIYNLLPFYRRRALHRRAALAIEAAYTDDIGPFCGQLASHWEHADDPARGATYRLSAAGRAMMAHANHEVIAHLRVIEEKGGHAALLTSDADRAEFARIWGLASEELGDFATARQWLGRCAALSGIPVRRGWLRVAIGIGLEGLRQLGIRGGLLFPSRATAAPRDALSAQLHLRFAEHAYYEGDTARLLEVTLTALNRAERAGAARELVTASGSFALGLDVAGLHRLADFYGARAMAVGRTAGPWDHGMAHLLNAVRLFAAADWPAVQAMTAGGAEIFHELGERDRYASCRLMMAFALIAQCDFEGARRLVDEFGEHAEDIDNAAMRDFALVARSLVDLLTGGPPGRVLARLKAIRGERLSPGEMILCRGIESAAALASGDLAHARELADLALELTRRQLPTISIAYYGVAAMTATQRSLAAAAPTDMTARTRATTAMKLLRKFARHMPVSRPFACWLAGLAALDRRRPQRATRQFLRGVRTAERLRMPLEAALCRRALAAAGLTSTEHTTAATDILDQTGAVAWIEGLGTRRAATRNRRRFEQQGQ
jgi:hypothetical protein